MRKPYREEVAAKWLLLGPSERVVRNECAEEIYRKLDAHERGCISLMLRELAAAKPMPKGRKKR